MPIINMNGGGSNPLNFKVTASTVVPPANMIPGNYTTSALRGITYTANSNGSIIVDGTATALTGCDVWGEDNTGVTLEAGTYTLSGCPAGGSVDGYSLCDYTTNYFDFGDGVTFTLEEETTLSFKIRVASGATVSNAVFWPRLIKHSATMEADLTNQKENTIRVLTSIPISAWDIREDTGLPNWEKEVGTCNIGYEAAYQAIADSVTLPGLNFLKGDKRRMFGQLTGCYQNQDGTSSGWKSMNAYIYKSGGWVQFSKEFAATIAVTYPEGSTLTCTDGKTTLTATTTTGSYTFIVGSTGTWTLSCTDGDQTATDTVEITADGQSESVELSYFDGYLYNYGSVNADITGGWKRNGGGTVTINSNGSVYAAPTTDYKEAIYHTVNKIDLKEFAKLTMNGKLTQYNDTSQARPNLCVWSSVTYGDYAQGLVMVKRPSTTNDAVQDYVMDVSSLTGSYYIGIAVRDHPNWGAITMNTMKLT